MYITTTHVHVHVHSQQSYFNQILKKKTFKKSCNVLHVHCILMFVQMTYYCGSSTKQHKLPVSLKQLLG